MKNEMMSVREMESRLVFLKEVISRTDDQETWNDLQSQINFMEEALATAKAS